MIDVCYYPSNSPTAWPNCPEPYRIEFAPLSDSFPRIQAGQVHTIGFNVYDHACDDVPFPKDHYTYDEMDIDLYFYSHDDDFDWDWYNDGPDSRHFTIVIEPDGSLPAGLYEGLLSVTDTYQAPNNPLERKIWVYVTRTPDVSGSSYDDDLEDVDYISSPVRADINDDGDLETIFTAGGTVWALGQDDWGPGGDQEYVVVHASGFFAGTPTIVDDLDDDDCRDILLAWDDNGGLVDPEVCILSGADGSSIWTEQIDYAPVGHPVMVNVTNSKAGEEVVILTEHYYYLLQGPENITGDRVICQGYAGTITGAPAVLHDGGKTSEDTIFFWISHEDDWTIEAWKYVGLPFLTLVQIVSEDLECGVGFPLLPGTYSPTIGSYNSLPVIYAPTVDKVWMYRWFNNTFTWGTAIWLPNYHCNWGAQIALGDMNRDGYEDIVVPHLYGISAYTGFTSPLDYSGRMIWSYSTMESEILLHFNTPVLIDCNGDSFLDVISGAWVDSGTDPGYRLQILDGSPFNNHERPEPDLRGMWSWGGDLADGGLMVVGQSPVLTETTGGNLRIGMTLKTNVFPDPHAEGDAIYRSIDTEFPFHWDDVEADDLYREPWLKSCFSLYNWNAWWNQSHPDYEE